MGNFVKILELKF